MSDSVEIKVEGLDRTIASLEKFPEAMAGRALIYAVRAALKPIALKAKYYCPVQWGALRDSITTKAMRLRDGWTFYGMVGPQRGVKFDTGLTRTRGEHKGAPIVEIPTKYVSHVELGTSTREATPFLRPAIEDNKQNAVKYFQEYLEKNLDKAVDEATR
jgi:HK97 gp10 family phage protein